jgi:type A lantibiotic
MSDTNNQAIQELRDDELDTVCGGSEPSAGITTVNNELALHAMLNLGWSTWDTQQNKSR